MSDTRHTIAPPGYAYEGDDEDSRLVPVTYDNLDRAAAEDVDLERLRTEILMALLRQLCQPALSPLQIGRHALMLLDGMHRGDCDSLGALAKRLQVTKPRLTQLFQQMERQNPVLYALIRRAS